MNHRPRLRAAPIMGVNKHSSLITPHNGGDQRASIPQRGVLKEEWRPSPAGWQPPRPTPGTFAAYQKSRQRRGRRSTEGSFLFTRWLVFTDAGRRNRGCFTFGPQEGSKKGRRRRRRSSVLPVAGALGPRCLRDLVNNVAFYVWNRRGRLNGPHMGTGS